MNYTKGDYMKFEGNDNGVYFTGKNWESFDCVGCMFASGKITKRVQTNFSILKKYQKAINKHDTTLHNDWIKAGKPVKK